MAATTTDEYLTVEQFMARYGDCSGVELVRGKVVWAGREEEPAPGVFRMPKFKHGVVRIQVGRLIGDFVRANDLGWVAGNDTFVPIGGDPPAVRGADFLYVSYGRLPKGEAPDDLTIPPDLVADVRSPTDRWGDVIAKVAEYLKAGVSVVVLLDPKSESAAVYRPDEIQQVFHNGDELTLPDVLPGFAVPVRRFFE